MEKCPKCGGEIVLKPEGPRSVRWECEKCGHFIRRKYIF